MTEPNTVHNPGPHNLPQGNGQPVALGDRVRSLRLGDKGKGGVRANKLPWALAAVFFVAASAFGYMAYARKPAAPDNSGGSGASTTGTATSGDVVLESKGYVIAAHQIQISPQVGGEIVWLD